MTKRDEKEKTSHINKIEIGEKMRRTNRNYIPSAVSTHTHRTWLIRILLRSLSQFASQEKTVCGYCRNRMPHANASMTLCLMPVSSSSHSLNCHQWMNESRCDEIVNGSDYSNTKEKHQNWSGFSSHLGNIPIKHIRRSWHTHTQTRARTIDTRPTAENRNSIGAAKRLMHNVITHRHLDRCWAGVDSSRSPTMSMSHRPFAGDYDDSHLNFYHFSHCHSPAYRRIW